MTKGRIAWSVVSFSLALFFTVLSFVDSIALIGKYRVEKINGVGYIEEMADSFGLSKKEAREYEDAVKHHLKFDISGELSLDVSFDEKKFRKFIEAAADEMGYDLSVYELEEAVEDFKYDAEDAEEEFGGAKWELDGDTLAMIVEDEEFEYDYELSFNSLTIEDEEWDEKLELKKEGFDLFFCPSMVLRELALCLIILGILLLAIRRKKPPYYPPSLDGDEPWRYAPPSVTYDAPRYTPAESYRQQVTYEAPKAEEAPKSRLKSTFRTNASEDYDTRYPR